MRKVARMAVLLLLAGAAMVSAASSPEAEVRSVLSAVAESARSLDADAMARLRAPDLVSVAGGQAPVSYDEWLSQTRAFYATLQSCDYKWGDVRVTFPDPGTAVVAATWSFIAIQKDGGRLEVQGAETYVLLRRDGKWLIVHQHESYRS